MDEPDAFDWGIDIESFVEWMWQSNTTTDFHNLAFDAAFIMDHIMNEGYKWVKENPKPGQFTSLISSMGKFFSVTVHWSNGITTEFRDSLKKLPMSVSQVAKAFNLDEGKGDLDYHKERPVGYEPTPEEIDYLRRDVQIIARAKQEQKAAGMKRLTIGADALAEFKTLHGKRGEFEKTFPILSDVMDKEIRGALRGGFTIADERFRGKMQGEGIVLDVNSLYPYIMYDRLLPHGVPSFHEGLPKKTQSRQLFIVSVTFTAKLKPGHIPCIQVKNNRFHLDTEYLKVIEEPTTMVLTNVDLEVYEKHYDMDIISYNGGWLFKHRKGFFKDYIEKWMEVKATTKGGRRLIAKLHLNALYGKFATNPNVTGKYPVLEDGVVKLKTGQEETRNPVYTAMGVFITAYARQLTLKAAQENYDVFAYADTDSLHLLTSKLPENLEVDDNKLGAWALEGHFKQAIYMRPKAYCELMVNQPICRFNKTVRVEAYSTHIAGLPEKVTRKLTFKTLVSGTQFGGKDTDNRAPGMEGKLSPKRVPGGIVLQDVGFTLKF